MIKNVFYQGCKIGAYLDGFLRDQYLQPIANAEIRFEHEHFGSLGSATTNTQGRFERRGASPEGVYKIRILAEECPATEFEIDLHADMDDNFVVDMPYARLAGVIGRTTEGGYEVMSGRRTVMYRDGEAVADFCLDETGRIPDEIRPFGQYEFEVRDGERIFRVGPLQHAGAEFSSPDIRYEARPA